VVGSGVLRHTDGAASVAALVRDPPTQVPRRRLWRIVSFLAFATLPAPLRDLYGVDHGPLDELRKRALCAGMRLDRPVMPPRMRFIAPAILAGARLRGEQVRVADAGLFLV
jgi:uncharacterized protein (DUF2236 family)